MHRWAVDNTDRFQALVDITSAVKPSPHLETSSFTAVIDRSCVSQSSRPMDVRVGLTMLPAAPGLIALMVLVLQRRRAA